MSSPNTFGHLGLSIIGLGTQYPPYALSADAIGTLATKYHPDSPSMRKVCSINRLTGIHTRSSIGNPDHPIVNQPDPPSISNLHQVFMSDGLPLALSAARKAISEARIDLAQITHVVSTTCTDSGNPGFDHFVCQQLGLAKQVEKLLLHGVGCAGGLAALRTASNLAMGHSYRGKPARILVLALEVSTTMVRSELDSIDKLQETRIGVCLFSDCAGAVILSNGIDDELSVHSRPLYDVVGWEHRIIPDTTHDLGFDVDPVGWKVVLTPRVPGLVQAEIRPAFSDLMSSLRLPPPWDDAKAADFDWAIHPGGATVLSGAEQAMGLAPEHLRASYDTYINHGNSSSATIFSVLDRMRSKDMNAYTPNGRGPREYVVGCAFGPGVAVEMCMLKRHVGMRPDETGLQTPPGTESDKSSDKLSEDGAESTRSDRALCVEPCTHPGTGIQKPRVLENEAESELFISQALASVELD